ncbi:MAG: Na+/H+ antiporter NhaA, partial [Sphingomonas sp.]
TWRMIVGIGGVAGIGFTISLFIAELAFAGSEGTEMAALAILAASLISGMFGYAALWSAAAPAPAPAPAPAEESTRR